MLKHLGAARLVLAAALTVLSCGGRVTLAQDLPGNQDFPDYDVKQAARATVLLPQEAAIRTGFPRISTPANATVRVDALYGRAVRVHSLSDTLTRPDNQSPETIARNYLSNNLPMFRLTGRDLGTLTKTREYTTAGLNITHLTLSQKFGNIPVFTAEAQFHITTRGEIVAVSNALVPDLAHTITANVPTLTPAQALKSALFFGGMKGQPVPPVASGAQGLQQTTTFQTGDALTRPPVVQLVYFPVDSAHTALAWDTTLWRKATPDVYHILVDATTGELLFRKNYTKYDAPHGQIFNADSPMDGTPYTGVTPPLLGRVDAPFNGGDFFPSGDSHYNWWAGQSPTTTISNNVSAQDDTDANDTGGLHPTAANSNFNFALNLNNTPTSYLSAAITNLFYWNNRLHDFAYHYGLTEAAGNFQTNNFGLGGIGGDPVQADAQDGSGTNNANFATPPDGSSGRMQMYVFTYTSPNRDGDFDNEVIGHEFGHGVSNRLVGNGNGLSGLQGGGFGEGHSDFWELMLLIHSTDDINGTYPVGGWVVNDFANGIRRQPYSTNPAIFTRTFGNIKDSTEVHDVGEIWCNTMWKLYARLVTKYGFTEGHDRTVFLDVDGMKLSPSNPDFLDLRDAILLADKNRYNNADYNEIWQVFASMGMGIHASTTGNNDGAPIENFDTPPTPAGVLTVTQHYVLPGEGIQISVADSNAPQPVKVTVTSSLTGDAEQLTLTPDPAFAGLYNGVLPTSAGAAASDGTLQINPGDVITVMYHDADTGNGTSADLAKTAGIAREVVLLQDTMENGNALWGIAGAPWAITTEWAGAPSPTHSWSDSPNSNYPDNASETLTSPTFDFSNAVDVKVIFSHMFNVEYGYDNVHTDYSLDGGFSWNRQGVFETGAATEDSVASLPGLIGAPTGSFRFHLLSDVSVNYDGWHIDNIRLVTRVPDNGSGFSISGTVTDHGMPLHNTTLTATGTVTTTVPYWNFPGVAIPDNNTSGVVIPIKVTDTGTVNSLTVGVDIAHSGRGDLEVALISPAGTTVLLHNRAGGSALNLATSYPDLSPSNQSLSALNGQSINGTWKLRVRDLGNLGTGTVNSWKLSLNYTGTKTVTTTTHLDGTYTIPGLPASTYTVTPTQTGYHFTPASRSVTVGPNQTNQNFAGNLGIVIGHPNPPHHHGSGNH